MSAHRPTASIDLNADLGEGVGDDDAMMPLLSSANLACGFHAGYPAMLRATCARAVSSGVRIGAQVSYPDRAGFGRRFIDVAHDDLVADVLYQVGALSGLAQSVGGTVQYVKPHGALYNTVVHHEAQAAALVDAVSRLRGLALMCLPGSVVARRAREAGVRVITEAFADRGYTPDGRLVPRTEPGALITDSNEIAERVVELARTGRIVAVDGTVLDVDVSSVCLHGDTPGALDHARAVREALAVAAVGVSAR